MSVWVVSAAAGQGGPPPANVVVDAARLEPVIRQRGVTGEVRASRASLLAAQVEGLVLELAVREGDSVERGQVIARLDRRRAELDAARAEAELRAAQGVVSQREAELERLKRDLARVRELDAQGSANPRELDRAETEVATTEALRRQAVADEARAEAELALERVRLEDMTITAPFRGRVVRRITEVGQWLAPGGAVVELVSLDDLEAYIDVPEHLLSFLPVAGRPVPVTVPGVGAAAPLAKVVRVVPIGDALSRVFQVRLALDTSAAPDVLPRMSLTALVPTGERIEAVTVSKDAVLRDQAGEFVFAAVPAGTGPDGSPSYQAAPIRVTSLFAVGERLVLRDGSVPAGMPLLTRGNERVFPTQPLVITNPEAMARGGEGGSGRPAAQGG